MEELVALFFGVLGLSSYPLVFFLTLKKSVSLTSKRNATGGRSLFSLVVVYFETALLSFLIAYFFPSDWPPYAASLVALSAIVLATGYTLKAAFDLTYWRGILAYFLWQALSLALGGLLVVTVMAAMLETIFTFILIVALMLSAWWMWGGQLGLKAGRNYLRLGGPDKRVMTIAMVALLCSSLVVPSAVVRCAPEEQEVDVDFTWENNGVTHTVGANITWNATAVNATVQSATAQANGGAELVTGVGQGVADIIWSIVYFPASLYSLHDFKAATTYLSLINDVTQLQGIMEPQKPLLPPNSPFDLQVGKESASTFAKDGALASELADMDRKEYKCEVASNPDVISKEIRSVFQVFETDKKESLMALKLTGSPYMARLDFEKVHRIAASDWVNKFQTMLGLGKYLLLEVPLDLREITESLKDISQRGLADRIASSAEALKNAESQLRQGEWRNAIRQVRDAIEAINKGNIKTEAEISITKAIKNLIDQSGLPQKSQDSITMIIDNLMAYTSATHHVVQNEKDVEVEPPFNKEDAIFAIGCTALLLNVLAKKLLHLK